MNKRVVVTGIGVVAPNGVGIDKFNDSLFNGSFGMRVHDHLKDLNIKCFIAGIPSVDADIVEEFCKRHRIVKLKSSGILYGCMAGIEAWIDAGLKIEERNSSHALWDSGCVFGSSCVGIDAFDFNYKQAKVKNVKKIGGRIAQQAMNSGVSAYLGGILGLGNQVTTNASETNTGLESIINGYYRIKWGLAEKMLVGSTEGSSPYLYGAYETIRTEEGVSVTYNPVYNDAFKFSLEDELKLHKDSLGGIMPGSGSGAMVIESLQSAQSRSAKIYAEIVGTHINSGGQTNGGGLISTNQDMLNSCITSSLSDANVQFQDLDILVGQFQSNYCDLVEKDLLEVLLSPLDSIPNIVALKPLISHCLGGSGSIEAVATILMLSNQYLVPSFIGQNSLPSFFSSHYHSTADKIVNNNFKVALKYSYGVGDVNSSIVIKKWEE
ncbi:MAG: beta-ketoacyl-ACP synthase [Pseudopedobacter saltans]|uniref:3-oxoacyl-[acyl-carrier-protein] synthase 1 n=1 Tax=Pseudopedobacter saltans TaxID=151895 RepID=A0A2W5H5E0_9SPHI|nr:MAG: beta-ketoacyl-ACP synthase [Pseudopedobacter saltans]